jgi:hypothetical protein
MATGAPNAILAVNSLDRYIKVVGGQGNQPLSNYLVGQYFGFGPYSNNFTISSPAALIYGYINRIVISQIQIQYNIPTVINGVNNRFFIGVGPVVSDIKYPLIIPYGYYTPDELAAQLQVMVDGVPALAALDMTVVYDPRDGFSFDATGNFYFPDLNQIEATPGETTQSVTNVLKTYRLLGMNVENSIPAGLHFSTVVPNFLYTPYIDFYSDVLTNYQNVKDTNTSVAKPKGLIARVYLSGNGSLQSQTATTALGSEPFVVTADMNSPKIIKWTPDVAVPSIDFQLRDCYGDLIPTTPTTDSLSTEFQMTLLCVEDDR